MDEDPWCQVTKVKEQYRRLKEEHQRLQLDYENLEKEYKAILDGLAAAQSDCAKDIETLQSKNRDLERELYLLRPMILTPETENLIRIKATEEIELRYSNESRQYLSQLEEMTGERNELRRENDFLKGELGALTESVERVKSEYKQRLESETASLVRQRETLSVEERTRAAESSRRINQLDLENRQISLRLNGVMKENEELAMSLQKLQSECNSGARDSAKRVAALQGQVTALIAERDCNRQQSDMLSREIASLSEANVRLTARVHDLERQNGHLQAIIDEMTHNHAMELNNAKLQYFNERSALERERTELKFHQKECDAERDSLRLALDQKTAALIEKDRECQHRIAMVNEEAVRTKTSLEDQISDMNSKLAEAERRCRTLEDKLLNQKDNSGNKLDILLKERDGLNLEIVALKEEVTRLRNRPEPVPLVIDRDSNKAQQTLAYPPEYIDKLETKIQSLKSKLRSAKEELKELKSLAEQGQDARKRLDEKNQKLKRWVEEFCRGHSRFLQLLETVDSVTDKENSLNNGISNNDDVVNMVRYLNEKVASIEQRTARQLGMSALGSHQLSPYPETLINPSCAGEQSPQQ